MTHKERLLVEIQTIDTMLWLIKDRATTLDAYRAMEAAMKQRQRLLELQPSPPPVKREAL